MNCEICGKELSETPLKAKIDGVVMSVCKDCSKFGKIQKEPPKPKYKKTASKSQKSSQKPNKYRSRDEPAEELVDDYETIIRKARESKKWSREELAEKLYEKASVVNRVESGKMTPDTKLIKKLEKVLNIKLLEKYDDLDIEEYRRKPSDGFTLGDMIKIKKK
ncbi:multiprotein bridging factor aMBF1 [Methanobrevibacter sp. DSM 116169]|uniref:multiprotein bridging factor aMBF1 n=1 Tax=Methanobrevibacter sp. DSM 116169 TaxID=3242727 RepID=UPI0038FD1E62